MVSSIYTAKKSAVLNDVWKFASIFYPTIAMTANILLLILLINNNLNEHIFNSLIVKYTEISKFNFLLNLFFHLIIPLFFINYYLVLWKDKHIKLIEHYHNSFSKKFISIYLLVSIFALLAYLLSLVEIRW